MRPCAGFMNMLKNSESTGTESESAATVRTAYMRKQFGKYEGL